MDIVVKVFSETECNLIIKDFIENTEHVKLSTDHGINRISSYEIDIKNLSNRIRNLINNRVNQNLLSKTGGKIGMVFGVRYSLDTKSDMEPHYDCSSYSCVIKLNSDYEGGGTYFPLDGGVLSPTEIGDGLLFKADTIDSYHSAYPITKGVRYVLVVRIEKHGVIRQLLKACFLHFVDKYIRKNKIKLYKKPLI